MTKFPIPSSPAKKILDIDNFNGVDFTSKVPDISRSNNAINVIKRNGYHQIRKAFRQYVTSKPTQAVEEIVDSLRTPENLQMLKTGDALNKLLENW